LTDLVIQPGFADLVDVDIIRLLEDDDLRTRYGAEDPDREAWARERVPVYQVCGDIEESA
jgi:hypothetical protein